MIDWIKEAWNDLIEWFKAILQAIFDYFSDLFILVLDGFLGAVSSLIASVPVPDFLSNGLGSYLNGIDSGVLYFLSQSGITPAFAILGAGVTFRLLRKLFTLGQW
jgi:hypothetical protein